MTSIIDHANEVSERIATVWIPPFSTVRLLTCVAEAVILAQRYKGLTGGERRILVDTVITGLLGKVESEEVRTTLLTYYGIFGSDVIAQLVVFGSNVTMWAKQKTRNCCGLCAATPEVDSTPVDIKAELAAARLLLVPIMTKLKPETIVTVIGDSVLALQSCTNLAPQDRKSILDETLRAAIKSYSEKEYEQQLLDVYEKLGVELIDQLVRFGKNRKTFK